MTSRTTSEPLVAAASGIAWRRGSERWCAARFGAALQGGVGHRLAPRIGTGARTGGRGSPQRRRRASLGAEDRNRGGSGDVELLSIAASGIAWRRGSEPRIAVVVAS